MIAVDTQIVGQSLTLECSVITVRGIVSSVDLIWSIYNGPELARIEGANKLLHYITQMVTWLLGHLHHPTIEHN